TCWCGRRATSVPHIRVAEEGEMAVKVRRREFLAGAASAAVSTSLAFPAIAQPKPVRIGLLTVKTGPLAAGGIQMEQGTIRFLKDRSYTLAGRKIELIVGDTGG